MSGGVGVWMTGFHEPTNKRQMNEGDQSAGSRNANQGGEMGESNDSVKGEKMKVLGRGNSLSLSEATAVCMLMDRFAPS